MDMNSRDFYPEILRPYDARFVPLPAPTQDICDPLGFCIYVNQFWWSHLSGQIQRLLYRDAWLGTEDEIDRAIDQINKVLNVGGLTMGCGCGGTNGLPTRINSDGVYQISYDGGATWTDAPQADPRNNAILQPPLTGDDGDDKKCQAAGNITGHIKNKADQLTADASAWGDISLLVAAFVGLMIFIGVIGTLGAATPLILGFAGGLLAAGKSAFDAAMTSDVYAKLDCIFYCNMGDDGTISAAQYATILSQINSKIGGVAQTYIAGVVNAWGVTGLNNAARTGSNHSADCSGCCAACDPTIWTIFNGTEDYGTIVSYGVNFLIADLQNAPSTVGEFFLRVKTPTTMDCCKITGWEKISGSDPNISAYALCGATQDGSTGHSLAAVGGSGTDDANLFVFGAPAACRVKVTFA